VWSGVVPVTICDAAGGHHSETVTPEVGANTVMWRAPGTGWSLGWASLSVTYRAPQLAIPSTVDGGGATFDVAGLGDNLGWKSMGLPVIVTLPKSIDSAGSSALVGPGSSALGS
jgi:hypothetical protein